MAAQLGAYQWPVLAQALEAGGWRLPACFPRGCCFPGLWPHHPAHIAFSPPARPIAPVFLLQGRVSLDCSPPREPGLSQDPSRSYLCEGPVPHTVAVPGPCTQTRPCLLGADPRLAAADKQAMQPHKTPSRAPFDECSAGTTLNCVTEQGPLPFLLLWAPLIPAGSGPVRNLDSEKPLLRICPGHFPGQRPACVAFPSLPAPSWIKTRKGIRGAGEHLA